MKKWFAASELLLATIIWGFGFTASIWALTAFDPITISIVRFGVSFLIGVVALVAYPKWRHEFSRANFFGSMVPGLMLGATLCLQTWGLEYTTATKSGFITTLYVVTVPILDAMFFHVRLDRRHFIWVLLALVGTAMMVQLQLGQLNTGDLLTFACSFTAAFQILFIVQVSGRITSPFAFNTMQSFWCALAAVIFIPFYGHLHIHTPSFQAALGLCSLTFLSTLLAFALQVKAQKVLSPGISSVIFLLESPFAAIFAMIFLHETLTVWQSIGGVLIFVAAYRATQGAGHESKSQTATT
jgi:drug/metabolite transporter (DMT)-like permease